MPEETSAIAIARKQRYIHLLEKVRANKPLTAAEVRELAEYEAERQTSPAPATASDQEDTERIRQVRRALPKPAKRARRAVKPTDRSALLTEARVRKLALDHADLTSADAHLGRRYDLVAQLAEHRELEAAWRRGRLLRNIRRLAATGTTLHEAAHHLSLEAEELRQLIATDIEVANVWNEARLDTAVTLKQQWLAKAGEGNVRAIAQVQAALQNEIAHAAMDIHTVPEAKMEEIAGVTRQTLNRWLREEKMPRNAGEATYDLPTVWSWFGDFVKQRCQGTSAQPANPLQLEKAKDLEMRRRQRQGELVELAAVEAGWVARERALVSVLERVPEQYAAMAAGKTKQQLLPMFKALVDDIRREFVAAVDTATANN